MTMQKLDFLLEESRKGRPMTLALACPYGDDALAAVTRAGREGVVKAVLVGDAARIRTLAGQDGCDLSGVTIVDEKDDEKAVERSVRMVSSGEADLLMKGLVKTSTLLKAVLDKEWGLRTGSLLSHLFLFEIPAMNRRVIGISDGGMNTYPDLNAKAKIIENAVACYHKIGVPQPRIAALAAVEAVNPDMQATLDAAALAKMNERGQIRGCIVDGSLCAGQRGQRGVRAHQGYLLARGRERRYAAGSRHRIGQLRRQGAAVYDGRQGGGRHPRRAQAHRPHQPLRQHGDKTAFNRPGRGCRPELKNSDPISEEELHYGSDPFTVTAS